MTLGPDSRPVLRLNATKLSCYSVAGCSFAAALLGLGYAHGPIGGLTALGAFFFCMSFLSRPLPKTVSSASASDMDNLVAEKIVRTSESVDRRRSETPAHEK